MRSFFTASGTSGEKANQDKLRRYSECTIREAILARCADALTRRPRNQARICKSCERSSRKSTQIDVQMEVDRVGIVEPEYRKRRALVGYRVDLHRRQTLPERQLLWLPDMSGSRGIKCLHCLGVNSLVRSGCLATCEREVHHAAWPNSVKECKPRRKSRPQHSTSRI